MTVYGVMQVGRLAIREDDNIQFAVDTDGTSAKMTVSGQESSDRLNITLLRKRMDDLMGLQGGMLPVTFSHKAELNGFYKVTTVGGTYRNWSPENLGAVPWSLALDRIGYASEVNLESRLSGPLTRANDHVATGKRWHAPPVGHTAYAAGSTTPLFTTRTTSDGAMVVYNNLAINLNPRWASTVTGYLLGRCRFLDGAGTERAALQMPLTATGWTLTNGLVQLQVNAGTGRFEIAAWTGGAWQVKSWELFHNTGPAVTLGVPDTVALLRNDFEVVTVRMIKALNPGRVTVDFTLRRGSRFLEIYVQHQFGTTLKLVRSAAEASTASTGYLKATAADGAGNKYVLGSARSFTADNVNGGISKTATPTLDAFVGIEVSGAASGDLAADLFAQYLGSPAELVQGVRY